MKSCSKFIYFAIEGKYPFTLRVLDVLSKWAYGLDASLNLHDLNYNVREKDIDSLSTELRKSYKSSELLDVARQLLLCRYIKNILCHNSLSQTSILKIHKFLLDVSEVEYRTTNFVNDFDGCPPVDKENIQEEYETLNNWIVSISCQSDLSPDVASSYLAKLISRLIAIHYFKDANGRIARFLCLYFCLRWGFEVISIPKIRNDIAWKKALVEGVAGDTVKLQKWFLARLTRR